MDHNLPRTVYTQRLAARQSSLQSLEKQNALISNGRLAAVAFGIAGYFVLSKFELQFYWLPVPAIVFFALVMVHSRVQRQIRPLKRAIKFYKECIARIENKWAGHGNSGESWLDSGHLFSADLDLFGKGSLFELLCTAQTRAGEFALASWLLNPADDIEIRERQRAVEELRNNIDLREQLAILGTDIRENVRPELLEAWGKAPRTLEAGIHRTLARILAIISVLTVGIWVFDNVGRTLFLINACLIFAFSKIHAARVADVNGAVENAQDELSVLARVLAHLEKQDFKSPRLISLQEALNSNNVPASDSISQLLKQIRLLDAQHNKMFAIPSFLLLWPLQFAYCFEDWREKHGKSAGPWLHAVGELEAFCALAGYAYDHPDDVFPEVLRGGLIYDGEALGHPFLCDQVCVRNDVRFGDTPRVLIVSGSNMSGKSTLLRTVGINAVLALAGAPVHAKRLRLCPVSIGATLRVQDSLQAGASRFYAEIARLKQLVDLADGKNASSNGRRPFPLLFLLDEILHGTNSHDRQKGAELIVNGLLDKGAIGLVTTHDLALANTVDALRGRAENVHFDDTLQDGKLIFDYTMRPGVVQKSNAMELMRAVGLPV